MQALEHGLGAGIGLLAFHAPIFQFLERNRGSGHRATYDGPRTHNPKIAGIILYLRFAARRRMGVEAMKHKRAPDWCGMSDRETPTAKIGILPTLLKPFLASQQATPQT